MYGSDGINLAIQVAVSAANLLTAKLKQSTVTDRHLAVVQNTASAELGSLSNCKSHHQYSPNRQSKIDASVRLTDPIPRTATPALDRGKSRKDYGRLVVSLPTVPVQDLSNRFSTNGAKRLLRIPHRYQNTKMHIRRDRKPLSNHRLNCCLKRGERCTQTHRTRSNDQILRRRVNG